MQECSQFLAADKILTNIYRTIRTNVNLKRFEIIADTRNDKNKSPVHVAEDCLGLESWCVKHLYQYGHRLLQAKPPEEINKLLTGILLLNPDIATYWSLRRKWVPLDLEYELRFTLLALSVKPTSLEVFNHRKWAILQSEGSLFEQEMETVYSVTEKYPNNYHAWQYAKTITAHFLTDNLNRGKALYKQWFYSEKWLKRHVSDHSALTYRQFLLKTIFRMAVFRTFIRPGKKSFERQIYDEYEFDEHSMPSFAIGLGLLLYELQLNNEMIEYFEGKEALWHHRRFVFYFVHWLIQMYTKKTGNKFNEWAKSTESAKDYLDLNGIDIEGLSFDEEVLVQRVFQELPKHEASFLNSLSLNDPEQKRLRTQHIRWLDNYLALTVTLSYW